MRNFLSQKGTSQTRLHIIDGYAGFLYYDKNGMPLVAMHWEHRFNNMVKRYNDIYRLQLPNITPHVCRHTYCSNMAMNTYTHLGLEDAQDELRRMEELEQARKEVAGKGSETA